MGGWKKLGTKTVYSNPWINLNEDQVLRPDGKPGTYSILEIPKPSVAIIPFDNDSIYLIENFRYPIDRFSLEIPQGASTDKEGDLLSVAKQELEEETGFHAEKWEKLNTFFTLPFISNDSITFFVASILTKGERHLEATETIKDAKKYSVKEILEKISRGEITQTTTVAGIMTLLIHQKRIAF